MTEIRMTCDEFEQQLGESPRGSPAVAQIGPRASRTAPAARACDALARDLGVDRARRRPTAAARDVP